ncbi:protein GAMETE CELL DEFECTIVE 1, mitochondrial isoform X1 [Ziziphus jujuba]|uniref:Protein GAMETE CELL DEFECTIVE 1, mitochondrial isoform X1 n=1 Tax=Ziziphus jujuba TaxID=326968 RepID=A0A6P4AX37_ZIZJJ|nr:protein GAMETE CELL DEFECTIVE 1, mitochondrial isoform X1 [Ziziphus jujuba]XP_015902117.3 protein GAMETE CELL DEFECTIVE 1, mitochondrial isoform X1 [Ziziphus jujuba]XP_024923550.3 protein GAMETE CELL DEFECTIVE 1, mitochondrial isoform X1 [Ziziphus jujuba]XP_048329843.2 protein GAMETE CELL DEFECTIVE 1, mitochondrial isoform X1 [Ziziphus jujuba]
MQNLQHIITRLSSISLSTSSPRLLNEIVKPAFGSNAVIPSKSGFEAYQFVGSRSFSAISRGDGENDGKDEWDKTVTGTFSSSGSDDLGWDSVSSWSTGLTKDHFDGEVAGRRASGGGSSGDTFQSPVISDLQEIDDKVKELEAENRKSKAYVDGWGERMRETCVLLKQVREPGARGSYLKDSEKAEMYRLHKENPEVYTVEKLAKDYRIMRQRVHAILWLKELEEEEEKKLGHPLDDSVELLLDTCPEFFNSHDREFHVASLPYKPDFKVMPEGWDGTTRDLDEVHYEISKNEDEMLYQEFVEKMNFNKKKMAGEVFRHKHSRRRPFDGWNFTVEKMGPRGKRGGGGGWKFVSKADGSSRPLNEMEKMYVRRETPRRRRKILP